MTHGLLFEDEEKSDDDVNNVNNNYPEKFNKKWSLHTQRAKPNSIAVIARERERNNSLLFVPETSS